MKKIPFVDLKRSFEPVKKHFLQSLEEIWENQQFILGKQVARFEETLKNSLGAHAVFGVNSGTDALTLIWKALSLSPDDEVLTTPYSFFSSASSLLWAGSFPEFVDIHPHTYLMDKERFLEFVQKLKPAKKGWKNPRTGRTVRGVLLVHLFGNPCEAEFYRDFCRQRGWFLVEDCAQAIGALRKGKRVGSFGIASAFSFYPTKNLSACGDAGAIASFSPRLSATLSLLRNHGQAHKYSHITLGTNSRLDEIQAAILNFRWNFLPKWNEERKSIASEYEKHLRPLQEAGLLSLPQFPKENTPVYHQYVIRIHSCPRDWVKQKLQENLIETEIHYPLPIHLQKPFRKLGYRKGMYPVAEKVAQDSLALPIYPGLTSEEILRICSTLQHILTESPAEIKAKTKK
ncbi:MAG: DegT/DnrJ/EryC1/StrS family aminotransferase [bacterium JZ-2024 1]